MADIANKYAENVSGKFYVDDQCIDCDLCRETAPVNFTQQRRRLLLCVGVSVVVVRIPIIRIAKPEGSEIGEETVAVEETVVAIETVTTEMTILMMPKSEIMAATPGAKDMARSGCARKKRLHSCVVPLTVTRCDLRRDR
jgi:hypothetical protein